MTATTKEQLLETMTWTGRQARATRRLHEFRQELICIRGGDPIIAGFEFPGSGEDDSAGEVWRLFMAMLIQSAGADAAVFASDTWVVRGDAAKDSMTQDIAPRNHPNREDAIAVCGILKEGYFAQETWTYKIRGGKGDFHGSERAFFDAEEAEVGGRMIDALRLGMSMAEPHEAEKVERMRDMLMLGTQVGIELVVHDEVWAAKYGAGLKTIVVPPMNSAERQAFDESGRDNG